MMNTRWLYARSVFTLFLKIKLSTIYGVKLAVGLLDYQGSLNMKRVTVVNRCCSFFVFAEGHRSERISPVKRGPDKDFKELIILPVNPDEIQPKEMSDKEWLNAMADGLEDAHVIEQRAVGEGSEVIMISKELAAIIIERMRAIAEKID